MKNFIRITAALLLSYAFATAASGQQFTMKISSPTINDVTHEWAKEFAAGLKARIGDKIKVEFYPASQLGQIPATVEGVAMGTIEAVAPASGFLIGLEPRMQVFDVPGLFSDMAHAQRVLADATTRARLATFASSKGMEMVAAWPHGPLNLVSHKHPREFRGLHACGSRHVTSRDAPFAPWKANIIGPVLVKRFSNERGRCPLLAQSGHPWLHCTCLLLTQSGHLRQHS
jgi:TRAP-type C4-dicarboxylate transport system substrate-binding protein